MLDEESQEKREKRKARHASGKARCASSGTGNQAAEDAEISAGQRRDEALVRAARRRARSLFTPSSIIFRIKPMPPELLEKVKHEPRFNLEERNPGAMWWVFEIGSESDLSDALWWIGQVYEHAK